MQEIIINTTEKQNSKIITGIDILANPDLLNSFIAGRNTVIISNTKVYELYKDVFKSYNKIIIPDGEQEKNLNRIEWILNKFVELGIDKKSIIIGFGGGVICDIAGFAASIYMRGAKFGFIASTLLAQVDAAIGGKNGVNLDKHKNYIGVINQPEFVLCDVKLLETLEHDEFKSGLAEVIKYAVISDKELFDILINNKEKIIDVREPELMHEIVKKSIQIKHKIIEKDPKDNFYRHILNFGHSFGHAIEINSNLKHGMSIIKGMKIACDISVKKELLSDAVRNKIQGLFELYEYDTDIKITDKHFDIIKNDKKKDKESINFVLIKNIAKPEIVNISFDELKGF